MPADRSVIQKDDVFGGGDDVAVLGAEEFLDLGAVLAGGMPATEWPDWVRSFKDY